MKKITVLFFLFVTLTCPYPASAQAYVSDLENYEADSYGGWRLWTKDKKYDRVAQVRWIKNRKGYVILNNDSILYGKIKIKVIGFEPREIEVDSS